MPKIVYRRLSSIVIYYNQSSSVTPPWYHLLEAKLKAKLEVKPSQRRSN